MRAYYLTVERLACLAATALAALPVSAELMVYPTRVVLEKNQRASQVELVNHSHSTKTYRVNLVNQRMNESGEIVLVETPQEGEQIADTLLRYSPRQVTLRPGESQSVRILLRKPADLAAGEYRSHLRFDPLPDVRAENSLEQAGQADPTSIGMSVQALVGVSIPVIVRHGATQARVSLTDLALSSTGGSEAPELSFRLQREGSQSVYGDLAVSFIPKGGGNAIEVARAGGVAVYVPNATRQASMQLQLPKGDALEGGSLHLTYRERPEAGGKLIAEARLALP